MFCILFYFIGDNLFDFLSKASTKSQLLIALSFAKSLFNYGISHNQLSIIIYSLIFINIQITIFFIPINCICQVESPYKFSLMQWCHLLKPWTPGVLCNSPHTFLNSPGIINPNPPFHRPFLISGSDLLRHLLRHHVGI